MMGEGSRPDWSRARVYLMIYFKTQLWTVVMS